MDKAHLSKLTVQLLFILSGVCMASLFGNMGRENVTYFVNWIETLHRLGATEVTINNSTLTFTDEVMRKAFQYYQVNTNLLTHFENKFLIKSNLQIDSN